MFKIIFMSIGLGLAACSMQSPRTVAPPEEIKLSAAMEQIYVALGQYREESKNTKPGERVGLYVCEASATFELGISATDKVQTSVGLSPELILLGSAPGSLGGSISGGYEIGNTGSRGNSVQITLRNPACIKPERFFRQGEMSLTGDETVVPPLNRRQTSSSDTSRTAGSSRATEASGADLGRLNPPIRLGAPPGTVLLPPPGSGSRIIPPVEKPPADR